MSDKPRFMMYDWDEQVYTLLETHNVVDAIYTAWNYEFDVYEVDTEDIIFSGKESNETNSDWLRSYGVRMIDDNGYRVLQSTSSNTIYRADWHE